LENIEVFNTSDYGISIDGSNHVLRNLTVHSTRGIWVSGSNHLLENCVESGGYEGIVLEGSSNTMITNCTTYNNNFVGIKSFSSTNITIENSTSYDNSIYGIYFYDTNYSAIRNSYTYGQTNGRGIQVEWSNNDEIYNNTIYDEVGISDSSFDKFYNNTVIGKEKGNGIYATNTNNLIIENSSFINFFRPIYVRYSNYTIIRNNYVNNSGNYDPDSTGIRLEGVDSAIVEGNTVQGYYNGTHFALRFGVWTCCPEVKNTVFRNNTLSDTQYGIGLVQGSRNCSVISNKIYASRNIYVVGSLWAPFIGAEDHKIINNTIIAKYFPNVGVYMGIISFNSTNLYIEGNYIEIPHKSDKSDIYWRNSTLALDTSCKNTTIINNTLISDYLLTLTNLYNEPMRNLIACNNNATFNYSFDIPSDWGNVSLINVMRIESDSCEPYVSIVSAEPVSFGSVKIGKESNATVPITIRSNMVNVSILVKGDSDFPDFPISSVTFLADKDKPYPVEEVQIEKGVTKAVSVFLPSLISTLNSLWKISVPSGIAAGSKQARATIFASIPQASDSKQLVLSLDAVPEVAPKPRLYQLSPIAGILAYVLLPIVFAMIAQKYLLGEVELTPQGLIKYLLIFVMVIIIAIGFAYVFSII
jgi:parallel beta-helix repeat protein